MGYKKYSEAQIAEAVIKLAVNHYDFDKTSADTGVSTRTLKRWARLSPKKGVPELLERAIERMLMVIPTNMKGQDWGIVMGILIDKWLILQGMPTQRIEGIRKQIESMGELALEDVLAEAQRVLDEARDSRVSEVTDPADS